MIDPDNHYHIESECLDSTAKETLKRVLVAYLMRQRICPACMNAMLQEILDSSDEIWGAINRDNGMRH